MKRKAYKTEAYRNRHKIYALHEKLKDKHKRANAEEAARILRKKFPVTPSTVRNYWDKKGLKYLTRGGKNNFLPENEVKKIFKTYRKYRHLKRGAIYATAIEVERSFMTVKRYLTLENRI